MSPRIPLSTLPLSQFISASASTSPSKKQTPLRQSALSMSLLPSPFLSTTTPRTATTSGPLSTLYERAGGGGGSPIARSRTRSRTPSSRLIEQEEEQEQLEGEEASVSTPPRRLLDLFVQSAEKDKGSDPDRVCSTRKEAVAEEVAPAWDFYFDDESSADSQQAEGNQGASARSVGEELEEEVPADAATKENDRLPPRRFRSSTSNSLLSIPVAETASAPASLPGSANPSPTRVPSPPQLSLSLPTIGSSSSSDASIRIQTPPRTTQHLPHSPINSNSYPPLNTGAERELGGFSEGNRGLFENSSDERSFDGLGFRVDSRVCEGSTSATRRGKKRTSEENGELLAETDRVFEKKRKTGP
ncbi:hypothetical protein JCM3765_003307 [Sporobolomyces pararoseus]